MTEETVTTPDQPENPGQQVTTAPQTTQAGENWEARYKGSVATIERLTLRNRELEAQLVSQSSEIEQLKAQLGLKETEKTAAVGERDKQLQELIQAKTTLENELAELRGLKLKVEVARELNQPALIQIADRIPTLADKEALKTVMQDIYGFAESMVKERERQLLAGTTPTLGPAGKVATEPSSEQEWAAYINKLQLGSKERAEALERYGDFLERKHQS